MNTRESYDLSAQRYFDRFRNEFDHVSLDRSALQLFAELAGPGAQTLDAGCGPGHVAAFLAAKGLSITGVDISPTLIQIAKDAFPDIDFRVGELADLPMENASVQAVVSRHSVIHTHPDDLDATFSEFRRVLRTDGRLFISFFGVDDAGEHGGAFDHKVCTAYQLDPDVVSHSLARQGIEEEMRLVRRPRSGERQLPHATLIAVRTGGDSG